MPCSSRDELREICGLSGAVTSTCFPPGGVQVIENESWVSEILSSWELRIANLPLPFSISFGPTLDMKSGESGANNRVTNCAALPCWRAIITGTCRAALSDGQRAVKYCVPVVARNPAHNKDWV